MSDDELIAGYIHDIYKNGDLIIEELIQKIDNIFLKDYHSRMLKRHESIRGQRRESH